ncbi:uncharacterized protein LOC125712391 isoform X4 [Brienomyrus brachyistius]|uniref:uncharacterized protein LOC125712391 isoform X4 n=1 Tax=Brienomyrus brachyistius TaxID=42636 RepID=UPI0020B23DEF|nr:uncharacterized protein LOC125712391 isoform X4 [Brienomyrus brachyistius]
MSRRRCILLCEQKCPLYVLPKAEPQRTRWLKFIFATVPSTVPNVSLCARHFTEDCFKNRKQFDAGFSQLLVMKNGAVPTVCGPTGDTGSQPSTSQQDPGTQQDSTTTRFQHVQCQTDPPQTASVGTQSVAFAKRKSVGTQLSRGTLKEAHMRSKGIQTIVSFDSVGTRPTSHYPDLPLASRSIKGSGLQPIKRSRLEEEEGETSAEVKEEPLDSTYNPGDSVLAKESDISDEEWGLTWHSLSVVQTAITPDSGGASPLLEVPELATYKYQQPHTSAVLPSSNRKRSHFPRPVRRLL